MLAGMPYTGLRDAILAHGLLPLLELVAAQLRHERGEALAVGFAHRAGAQEGQEGGAARADPGIPAQRFVGMIFLAGMRRAKDQEHDACCHRGGKKSAARHGQPPAGAVGVGVVPVAIIATRLRLPEVETASAGPSCIRAMPTSGAVANRGK
jgi:hypothetical protein